MFLTIFWMVVMAVVATSGLFEVVRRPKAWRIAVTWGAGGIGGVGAGGALGADEDDGGKMGVVEGMGAEEEVGKGAGAGADWGAAAAPVTKRQLPSVTEEGEGRTGTRWGMSRWL